LSSGSFDYNFATGTARVEMIPETAKLDLNGVQPDQLKRMLAWMGVDAGRAQAIIGGIQGHRNGVAVSSLFSTGPTFPGPPASFQEIEDLLSVSGVTPEIFYGTYVPAQEPVAEGQPRLVRRGGLADCLSMFGARGRVDANGADPAVLAAVGVLP